LEKSLFEAELIEEFEEIATAELKKIGARLRPIADPMGQSNGVLRFSSGKSLNRLQRLRVVNQVFQVYQFDVPRPRALLGQQHFDRIRIILNETIERLGPKNIQSFRLEAAGRDSDVFQRLISQIENELNIRHDSEAGDLFLRVKPQAASEDNKGIRGWELLVRQTIRPLSSRRWRKFNYPGALAAPVAAVMLDMADIGPQNKILNLMCGSGTLLAENSDHAGLMVGCDLNLEALAGARLNLTAAGATANLIPADVTQLPFADHSFDVLLADPPWGQLVGETQDIQHLYPLALQEAWRVALPGARFVVVTHLKKHMLKAIKNSDWVLAGRKPFTMGRVSPEIFLLDKPM
jgi:tRNA (guanine6-N2)-methyltransferase